MRKTSTITALALGLLLAAGALGAPAPVGTTAGKTYGEWSAAWWQWLLSSPPAQRPLGAQGAIDCAAGQSGPVWFLATAPPGTAATRSCTVPRGTFLFFPLLAGLTEADGSGRPEPSERGGAFLPGVLDDATCGLFATVDGRPVGRHAPLAWTGSPPFAVGGRDGREPPAAATVAASDGVWVMLPPLAPGVHLLRFGARPCAAAGASPFPGVDVTYHLTVRGAGGRPGSGGDDDDDSDDDDDDDERDNVRIIERLSAAFAAGDLDTILAIIDEDVIWIESEGIPYGGTFIGRDAVFEGVFAKIAEEWDGFTATVDEIFAAEGRRVIVLQRDGGTFKATGKSMEAPAISIWTLNRRGRVVRFYQVIDTQEVVSATLP